MKFSNVLSIITLIMTAAFSSVYANNRPNPCPVLSKEMVEDVIDNGHIATRQADTLAESLDKTNAQVLIDEPTANPFDTYYFMYTEREIDEQFFIIEVDSVLGKDPHEAKDRAKQILFADQEMSFEGHFDHVRKLCVYKDIDAASASHFPFKSKDEQVELTLTLSPFNDGLKAR